MQSPRPHTPMSLHEFADVNSQVDEHLAAEQEKREKMQELMSKVGTFREGSVCNVSSTQGPVLTALCLYACAYVCGRGWAYDRGCAVGIVGLAGDAVHTSESLD